MIALTALELEKLLGLAWAFCIRRMSALRLRLKNPSSWAAEWRAITNPMPLVNTASSSVGMGVSCVVRVPSMAARMRWSSASSKRLGLEAINEEK